MLRALTVILSLFYAFPLQAEDIFARGLIKAKSRAVLASEIGAVVNKTPLRSGDQFKKGDLLIGFDCRLLKSQKDKVEAQTKASKAQLANARDLEKMRSIGALDVTLAKADYDKARAELKIASLNVDVHLPPGLNAEQIIFLKQAAQDCPVMRSLSDDLAIQLNWIIEA